jgi:hypothetical protein
MQKKMTTLALFVLAMTSAQAQPRYEQSDSTYSIIDVIDEVFVKADENKSLDDFIEYQKSASVKYPNLSYGIYQGTSKAKSTFGETMKCYSLIALDPKTKKIRDFKIVTNIKPGVISSAGSHMLSISKKLVSEYLPLSGTGDVELDAEKEKNESRNLYYALAPQYENIIPKNFEQDKELRNSFVEANGYLPYFKYNFNPSNSLLKRNQKTTSIEGGVTTLGLQYKVIGLVVQLDENDTPSELKLDGGLGFGSSIEMACSNLKMIKSSSQTGSSQDDIKSETVENQEEPSTLDKAKSLFRNGFNKAKSILN